MLKKIIKLLCILSYFTCLGSDLKMAPGYHDQTRIIKMHLVDFIRLPAKYDFNARYSFCQNGHVYHQACVDKKGWCSICAVNLDFNLSLMAISKSGFDLNTACTSCNKPCIK